MQRKQTQVKRHAIRTSQIKFACVQVLGLSAFSKKSPQGPLVATKLHSQVTNQATLLL